MEEEERRRIINETINVITRKKYFLQNIICALNFAYIYESKYESFIVVFFMLFYKQLKNNLCCLKKQITKQ